MNVAVLPKTMGRAMAIPCDSSETGLQHYTVVTHLDAPLSRHSMSLVWRCSWSGKEAKKRDSLSASCQLLEVEVRQRLLKGVVDRPTSCHGSHDLCRTAVPAIVRPRMLVKARQIQYLTFQSHYATALHLIKSRIWSPRMLASSPRQESKLSVSWPVDS